MSGVAEMRARYDHKGAREAMSAYLDGALSAAERVRLERHLASCPACQRELSTLRETVALLRRAPQHALPRSFVLPVTAREERARVLRWQSAFVFMRTAAVAVSLLIIVLFSSDALLGAGVFPVPDVAGGRAQRVNRAVAPGRPISAAPQVEKALPEPAATVAVANPGVEAAPSRATAAPQPSPLPPTPALQRSGAGAATVAAPNQSVAEPQNPNAVQAAEANTATQASVVAGTQVPTEAPREAAVVPDAAAQETVPLASAPGVEPTGTPAGPLAAKARVAPPEAPATEPSATVAGEPSPRPSEDQAGLSAQTTSQEPEASTPQLSPLWRVWGTVRLLWLILLGVLLALLAGLVLAGQRRKV
jgi:anti-sigma factor RsiW